MSVKIESRSTWGARYQNGDMSLNGLASGVFAHHSVTTQLTSNATPAQERAQMRAIESIGQSRFRTGISYNVIVFPSGRAYEGVSFNRRGTHTGGLNSTVRSICFAGNYEANKPTDAQIATAARIFEEGKGKWWVKNAYLKGHRDQKATACPGKFVYARLDDIRSGVKTPTPKPAPKPVVKPATPKPAPVKPTKNTGKLDVDGYWGADTTKLLQKHFGTRADGIISAQWKQTANEEITAARFDKTKRGSKLIFEMQSYLKKKGLYRGDIDGLIGPDFISALQRHYGTPVDGMVSPRSPMVKAMQRALNAGRF